MACHVGGRVTLLDSCGRCPEEAYEDMFYETAVRKTPWGNIRKQGWLQDTACLYRRSNQKDSKSISYGHYSAPPVLTFHLLHLSHIFDNQLHKMAEILVLQAQIRGKDITNIDFWPYADLIMLRKLPSRSRCRLNPIPCRLCPQHQPWSLDCQDWSLSRPWSECNLSRGSWRNSRSSIQKLVADDCRHDCFI